MAFNMSPEMIRMAQEQMRNMTPEQLASMQRMAANMDPSLLAQQGINPDMARQASEQMSRMSPEEIASQMEKARNMSPEEMQRQMKGAQAQAAGQHDYFFKASEILKNDGNKLVGLKKYAEAEEKYRRAKDNLATNTTAAGKELRKSCMLNLSLCLLKLGQPDAAEAEATEVLQLDKRSLKGYYRRGLARQEKGAWQEAVSDLKRALSLSPQDEVVAKALADANAAAEAAGVTVEDAPLEPLPPAVEQIVTPGAAAAASRAGAPMINEDAIAQMRQAMRNDPEIMKTMADSMSNLSEEQIAAMQQMAPPGMTMTPDMIRQASEMMKNMRPEDMERMMEMSNSLRMPSSSAGGQSGGAMPSAQDMQGLLNNPEAMKMATNMMRTMKPEDLARMSQSAGMNMTPEQAEAVTRQMQNLTPEQMAKIIAAAGALQSALGRAKKARDWVLRNKAVALALLVLILALLVRRWMSRRVGVAVPVKQADLVTDLVEDEDSSHMAAIWS